MQEVWKGSESTTFRLWGLRRRYFLAQRQLPCQQNGNSITLASVLHHCWEQVSWRHRHWPVTHPESHSSQVVCGGLNKALSEMPAHWLPGLCSWRDYSRLSGRPGVIIQISIRGMEGGQSDGGESQRLEQRSEKRQKTTDFEDAQEAQKSRSFWMGEASQEHSPADSGWAFVPPDPSEWASALLQLLQLGDVACLPLQNRNSWGWRSQET